MQKRKFAKQAYKYVDEGNWLLVKNRNRYQMRIGRLSDTCFWNELEAAGLDKKLQENEWLCTCIFRQQQTVFSQQVAGGIILCKNSSELNLGAV